VEDTSERGGAIIDAGMDEEGVSSFVVEFVAIFFINFSPLASSLFSLVQPLQFSPLPLRTPLVWLF
jgi:hypothetical protein